jgi:crossover junction endodeoxyribonuclease RusA
MRFIEFVVLGTPVSQQARRRERIRAWQQEIASAAARKLPSDAPWKAALLVEIAYYYTTTPIDIDNLAKPVLDALKGKRNLMEDDRHVEALSVRRVALGRLGGSLRIQVVTPALREGLASRGDFLHVVVRRMDEEST